MGRCAFEPDPIYYRWIKSFLFTLVIEAPVFVLLARKYVPVWRAALAGAAGSCFTHPMLWFVWKGVIRSFFFGKVRPMDAYSIYIITGELLVSIIESFTFYAIVKKVPLARCIAASFFANAASFGIGVLSRKIAPWLLG